MNSPVVERPFGFNLVGHVTANLGLAVVARSIAGVIRANGFPLAAYDVPAGHGRERADLTYAEFVVAEPQALPYAVNLFVLGGNSMRVLIEEDQNVFFNNGFFNVAASFWELPTLPPRWIPALDQLDVFVAMSEFIRYAHEFALSGPRIVSGRMPNEIPDGVVESRARFGLPEDATVFVTSFEPHSDTERKNTQAVIRAFLQSVSHESRACLVVKINNSNKSDGKEHSIVAALRSQVADHPRIRLLVEPLDYLEVLALYKSCDVYVSLHRAEGLGLGMAEAMALGKPVIATAWSGNMTFMNQLNSCPVGYRLVSPQGSLMSYRESHLEEGTLWADPSIDEAAAWMRYLLDEPVARSRIGAAAAASMAAYNADARRGGFLKEIQSIQQSRQRLTLADAPPPRDSHARLLKVSRLARIQELERELDWIKGRPLYRAVAKVKRMLNASGLSAGRGSAK